MDKITEEFRHSWNQLNQNSGINEAFPEYIVEYATRIKEFMISENRKYQGALGNAQGMLDAIIAYANNTQLEDSERFSSSVDLIFDYLLQVRVTSQVPLNTTFFIRQKLKKIPPKERTIDNLKSILLKESEFHVENYKIARDKIAQAMHIRIIDRCEEYEQDKIVIGTHCHSGTVIKALKKSKDYIDYVIVSKTEPEQQGVLTANTLCEAGIPVEIINLEQYGTEFRKAKMFLFGIDAVSSEGTVLNKAGTRMIATLARTKELPVYFLGETYKYAQNTLYGGLIRIERRDVARNLLFNHLGVDLEKYLDNGLLRTSFQAFDTTKYELYDSIVSEQGFLPMREAFEREWAEYI